MKQTGIVRIVITYWGTLTCISSTSLAQFSILHSFSAGVNDGYWPASDLVVSGSTLYGTTQWGAAGVAGPGTVFRIDADGSNYAVVHKFQQDGSQGLSPNSKLAVAGSVIYGTAGAGNIGNDGTLFKVNSDGTGFQVLHQFAPSPTGASLRYNGVTLAGSKLYGMKQFGGTYDDGLVYSYDLSGPGYSTVHSFNSNAEGSGPWGDVIEDGSVLYGMTTTTTFGTAGIFRVNSDGTGHSILHTFTGAPSDGLFTYGSLFLQGTKLFGMTRIGGVNDFGTIFSLNTDGSNYTILHSFAEFGAILGDLVVDGSKIYGMTTIGGLYNRGSIFEFDAITGIHSVLHSFSGGAADGQYPTGSLLKIGSMLYGTTTEGGFSNHGTVFSFEIPEPSSILLLALAIPCIRRGMGATKS